MVDDTCNECGEPINCGENAILVVCPSCGKVTSVCANCRLYTLYDHGTDMCLACPMNAAVENMNKLVK